MRSERWERIKGLFEEARDLGEAERAALLARRCPEDRELRHEVLSLLRHQPTTSRWLAAFEDLPAPAAGDPPRRVGPYRLIRELGRGGMGRVFLAERSDGHYRDQVAVKILSPTQPAALQPGPRQRQRLRQERQILAGLRHPAIVRLLDGGETEDGSPYLVMDAIAGQPIDVYCAERGLGLRQRLELMIPICEAVHFAHRSLVVHRDLKPSNILIDDGGRPFLLDFGIAALLNHAVAPTALPGGGQGPLGTPHYASPEQRRGEAVSTATDVYALGAVLHRLILGRPPGDGESPLSPESADLPRRLRGDLVAILQRALAIRPEDRYGSAEGLGHDLRRCLDGRPVAARSAARGYRAGRFVRRHLRWIAAAGLVLALLAGGAAAALRQARIAGLERERAEAERQRAESFLRVATEQGERAEAVSAFLLELFRTGEGESSEAVFPDAAAILERGLEKIEEGPAQPPLLRATLLDTLGRVSLELDLHQRAEELLQQALLLRRRALGPEHREVAGSLHGLAEVHHRQGDLHLAEPLVRQALTIYGAEADRHSPEHAAALHLLGMILHDLELREGAETAYLEALAMRQRLFSADDPRIAESLMELGELRAIQGRLESAEELLRQVVEIRRRAFGETHPRHAAALTELAVIAGRRQRPEEAEALLRQALAAYRQTPKAEPAAMALTLNDLGLLLYRRDALDEAQAAIEESLRLRRQTFGQRHLAVADSLNALAMVQKRQRRGTAARHAYGDALEIYRGQLGADSPAVATVLNNLGLLLHQEGRHGESETAFRRALEIRRRALGEDDPALAKTLVGLADLLEATGDDRQALPVLRDAREFYARTQGEAAAPTAHLASRLGACLARLGDRRAAEPHLRSGLRHLLEHHGAEHPRTLAARERLRLFLAPAPEEARAVVASFED